MVYLTTGDFPAIRAAIDLTLDSEAIADAVIQLPQYMPTAERWIATNNAEASTYTPGSDQWENTHMAGIYACAALLAPSLPVITSEAYGSAFRYTREKFDPEELAAALWRRAFSAMADAVGETEPIPIRAPARFVFTKASGRRGL